MSERVHRNSESAQLSLYLLILTSNSQIEDSNDPRDNFEGVHHDDDDLDDDLEESLPSLEDFGQFAHPLHTHNPWANADDPEEDDISSMRFQPVGPGRFHVQATIHRTISPQELGAAGSGIPGMEMFNAFLSNVLQGAAPQQPPDGGIGGDGQQESRPGEEGLPRIHRFTYSSNSRLHPRDDNHPEPRTEPVEDLNKYASTHRAHRKLFTNAWQCSNESVSHVG